MKNTLFQICKVIVILALLWCCFLFAGCYTKRQAIEKFCTKTKADTTIIKHDTIVLDSTHVDTVFSSRIDSIYIKDGKLSIKYIKVRDSVYLSGKYEADTIYRTDTIRVSIPVTVPNCERTWMETVHAARMYLLFAFFIGCILALYIKPK